MSAPRKPDGFDLMIAAHSPEANTRRAAETMLRRGKGKSAPRKPVAAYATLADVVRAKLAGTLPADLHVVVDNDSVCALSGRDADDYHGLSDDGPGAALVAVLDVLGIKAVRP